MCLLWRCQVVASCRQLSSCRQLLRYCHVRIVIVILVSSFLLQVRCEDKPNITMTLPFKVVPSDSCALQYYSDDPAINVNPWESEYGRWEAHFAVDFDNFDSYPLDEYIFEINTNYKALCQIRMDNCTWEYVEESFCSSLPPGNYFPPTGGICWCLNSTENGANGKTFQMFISHTGSGDTSEAQLVAWIKKENSFDNSVQMEVDKLPKMIQMAVVLYNGRMMNKHDSNVIQVPAGQSLKVELCFRHLTAPYTITLNQNKIQRTQVGEYCTQHAERGKEGGEKSEIMVGFQESTLCERSEKFKIEVLFVMPDIFTDTTTPAEYEYDVDESDAEKNKTMENASYGFNSKRESVVWNILAVVLSSWFGLA